MIHLGLTGSIGMGKSTIARMFAAEGVPVWDADETVHRLYAESEPLKAQLSATFGEVLSDDRVDRTKLSAILRQDPSRFQTLNAIVHPFVIEDRQAFARAHDAKGTPIIISDIPLLFETQAEKALDKIVVVSAPYEVQKARVLARPSMTAEKFAEILSRQTPDTEKRRLADYLIDTSQSLEACHDHVRAIIADLSKP